jgi:hypothetical protein|tara:strand:- start:284 stop:529 length:246 start_codon:yes stop_codon:yes gene_type:complete
MTTITFNNDEERKNFQISMALTMLRSEVRGGMIMCDPRKGTTVRTLARYFKGLKKTRKGAYKQLVDAGVYTQLDQLKEKKN